MANFIALIDPDSDRRDRFLRRVTPLLPPVEGLVAGWCAAPPFAAAWAADAHAPISVASTDGAADAPISAVSGTGAAVLFGTALRESGTPVEARELRDLWHRDDSSVPEPFDGYYAALAYDPAAGLLSGADILGRFPIYYFESGDVLLVGSSPELFQHHPSFRKEFDPAGLAGILLTNGLVEGRTLWSGVRRLGPGNLLSAHPGQPAREVRQYDLPLSNRYFDQPFARHVGILEEALDHAIRRHVPAAPRPVLMLSGGLDSRTIAGFLARQGISPLAVTRGDRHDIEMRCAVRVARSLRFEHQGSESDPSHYLADAGARVRWEHGASGFSGTGGWGGYSSMRRLGTRVVSGHSMDWVIGGNESHVGALSFDTFFDHQNRWGLRPATLDRLLRRDVFGSAVSEVMAGLRHRYESYSELESQRAWCFALQHRQRYHISSHLWAASFGAWPIVPAVDRELLALAGGLPPATLDGRRLQIELVCTRFPKLARLPLDRNSYNSDPLLPSFAYRARRALRRRIQRTFRSATPASPPPVERRRYFRQYDINGPGWRSIREVAEPHRRLGYEYFDPVALDELVPPPQAQIQFKDGITGPAGMKSILGFLLWLRQVQVGETAAP